MTKDIYNVLLISPNTIKSSNMLDSNIDDSAISACITIAQNIYLKDVIGDKLVTKLQTLVYNSIHNIEDNINDANNTVFKVFLDTFVKDVITYKAVSELMVMNTLKIKNAGVVTTSDTNMSVVSLNDIKYMRDNYETYFNSAVNRMLDFIKQNKNVFKDYTHIGCECEDKNKYGNTNLWLGNG